MLTIEMLRQNTHLSGLSETQLNAIAEMSKNDENTVIGTRIGELHGQYDSDVLSVTGIAKNQGEKSYDYVKRVLGQYKTELSSTATIQAQLANAKTEIETLKTKLAENSGDETLKQQLKDAKAQAKQLQTQLQTKETEFNKTKAELESQVKNIHVDYAFNSAISDLKFKDGITPSLQKIILDAAKAEVLTKGTPDFVEDATGNKSLIFRDQTGNIINNPANNLNPYTVKELLMQTSLKDIVETKVQQPGGGTKPITTPPAGGQTLLDLSVVKTQVDADKAIESYLLAQGFTRDSFEFAEQSLQLRTDNKVSELPLR